MHPIGCMEYSFVMLRKNGKLFGNRATAGLAHVSVNLRPTQTICVIHFILSTAIAFTKLGVYQNNEQKAKANNNNGPTIRRRQCLNNTVHMQK